MLNRGTSVVDLVENAHPPSGTKRKKVQKTPLSFPPALKDGVDYRGAQKYRIIKHYFTTLIYKMWLMKYCLIKPAVPVKPIGQ